MSKGYLRQTLTYLLIGIVFLLTSPRIYAELNAEYKDSLWVAQKHNLLKISSTTGQSLFQIHIEGKVQSVAVDKQQGLVWLANEHELNAYDLSGERQRSFSLSALLPVKETTHKEHHRKKYKSLKLKVDESDGTLWLHDKNLLWHVTAKGVLLHRFSIKSEIENITLISSVKHVWLASKKTIYVFDIESGQLIRRHKSLFKSKTNDLAYDQTLNEIWLADKKTVRRLTTEGKQTYQQDFHHPETVQPDGKGNLWIATKASLFFLDASGAILFQLNPFNGEHHNKIKSLVIEPANQSVWAVSEHALVHIDKQGAIQQRVNFKKDIEDVAFYSDLIAPLLGFILPAQGDVLNTATPTLTLHHSDNGIGTDNNTLSLQQDKVDLPVNCQHIDQSSTCLPDTPLDEGLINLSATVKDYIGNTSDKATTSFTVDTIAPSITINSHWNGAYVNQSAQTLVGSLSEFASFNINTIPVTLNLNHIFSYPVLLFEGQNNFLLHAQDEAANVSTLPFVLFLDTVPPEAAQVGKIDVSDVIDGQTTITGTVGSVETNATIEITNLTTNVITTIQANADGSFSLTVHANPDDKLNIIVIDKAGNRSAVSEVNVPLPLSIEITSPINGAIIEGNVINIEGIFKGPLNSGITVNGHAAVVSPEGTFILNSLSLNKGDNILEFVLTTLNGDTVSEVISVTSDGLSQPFKFEPNFNSGPAPFNVTLEFAWYNKEPIQKIEVDYEGDGVVDYTTSNEKESFTTIFIQPGIYRPRITVTSETGTYQKQVVILAQSRESMIQMFTAVWDDMNKALVQGDLMTALTYLDDFGKREYAPVFEVLKDKMPQIIQSYSAPQGVLITGNVGELAVNRLYKGQNRIYFIYFMRGQDGVWKLHNM